MASRVTFVLSSGVRSLYLVGYVVHEDRNRERIGPFMVQKKLSIDRDRQEGE